jgi:hypothetical protein
VIALALFVCLSGLPAILSALHLKINAAPPTSSDRIRLLGGILGGFLPSREI